MNADKIIEEILKFLNINAKMFSESLGYERPQIIYDVLKGKTKRISEDLSIKITSVYPYINKVWLLTGDGDMLNIQQPISANTNSLNNKNMNKKSRLNQAYSYF